MVASILLILKLEPYQNDEGEDWYGSFCPGYLSQAFEQKEVWGFFTENKEKLVWWLKECSRGARFGTIRGCLGKTNQPTSQTTNQPTNKNPKNPNNNKTKTRQKPKVRKSHSPQKKPPKN